MLNCVESSYSSLPFTFRAQDVRELGQAEVRPGRMYLLYPWKGVRQFEVGRCKLPGMLESRSLRKCPHAGTK